MPARFVTAFVRLCTQRVRQAGYLKFLCGLCVCDGTGILSNQTMICKRVLEENAVLLLQLRLQNGAIEVRVPEDEELSFGDAGAADPMPVHINKREKRRLPSGQTSSDGRCSSMGFRS